MRKEMLFLIFLSWELFVQEDWVKTGLVKLEAKDYPAAIQAFTRAIEADPKNADAYYGRGTARRRNGEDSLPDLNKAIELDPQHGLAVSSRAISRLNREEYDGAKADVQSALELAPDLPEALSNCAYVQHYLSDYKGAIANATRAIRGNPKDAWA
jgi:tetratricopeptide (TPR) repeat protein